MEVEQSKTPVSSSPLQEGKSVMALRLGIGKK